MNHPRLALSFTLLKERDRVRLVAGEEFRYTLTGPGLDTWLPALLELLDGKHSLDELFSPLAPERQAAARQILDHLAGERILVDGPVESAHPGRKHHLSVEGTGVLRSGLQGTSPSPDSVPARVLVQDKLDLDEALRFNTHCLQNKAPWLWVSCAAGSRGYVSPVFLPDAGPCLACLFSHFRRLSPLPQLYDELVHHARTGGTFASASFPLAGVTILQQLAIWKVDLLAHPEPAVVYRLHVLEVATLEVSAHPVLVDPECQACHGRR